MKRLLPPHVFFLSLLGMLSVHLLSIGPRWWNWEWGMVGLVFLVGGLALTVSANRYFAKRKATIMTFDTPVPIVTTGWFRYSRNPMYVGFCSALLGVAILSGFAFGFLFSLAFWALVQYWYIPFEEAQMRLHFAEEYRDYCQNVRRWF